MNKLLGERIYLQLLGPSDVTSSYLDWLMDSEVTKFLESRFESYTLTSLKAYVQKTNRKSSQSKLFGIFLNTGGHIGNIKLDRIDKRHKRAAVGILIGDKGYWGKGYATEAIGILTAFAFTILKLHKLLAGVLRENTGSIKAFQKSGFVVVGQLKDHRRFENGFSDEVVLEKINK